MSEKTSGQNLGIVENQQIVGPQQLGKVAKHAVVEAIVIADEVQQPRSRPVGQRFLGDQLVRQTIIEIGDQHKAIMPERMYITAVGSHLPFCGNRFLR